MIERKRAQTEPISRLQPYLSVIPPWIWLGLAGLFLFLFKAGLPLTDGDSAFYGVIARNMLETNDWQTLRYTDSYGLVDKPPLTIWLIAFSYMLLGINEVALRGWHALMSVGTILLLYSTVKLFYGRTVAALSGWILLTAALFAYSGYVPQQDIPLTFFSTLAFYGLARFLHGAGAAYTYLAWVAAALGFLTRGPQAIVFVAFVAMWVLYGTWRQAGSPRPTVPQLRTIFRHLAIGMTLFVAIAVPWFVLEFKQHGWPIINLLLGTGQTRFLEASDRGLDIMRFWSYFPLLIVAFLPWSGLIGHGVAHAIRQMRQSPIPQTGESRLHQTGNRLFLGWFLIAFFLPFVIQWRVIRYLLPAIPALAVLVAVYLAPLFDTAKTSFSRKTAKADVIEAVGSQSAQRGIRFAAWLSLIIVVPVLLLITAIYAQAFSDEQAAFGKLLTPFLLAIAIGIGSFVVWAWRHQYRLAVVGLIAGSFVAYGILFASVGPHAEVVLPSYATANAVNALPDDAAIWVRSGHDPFVEFYVQKPLVRREQFDDAMAAAASRSTSVLLVGDRASVDASLRDRVDTAEVVWQQDHMLIARVFPTTTIEDAD